jgi:hypothetical protein
MARSDGDQSGRAASAGCTDQDALPVDRRANCRVADRAGMGAAYRFYQEAGK